MTKDTKEKWVDGMCVGMRGHPLKLSSFPIRSWQHSQPWKLEIQREQLQSGQQPSSNPCIQDIQNFVLTPHGRSRKTVWTIEQYLLVYFIESRSYMGKTPGLKRMLNACLSQINEMRFIESDIGVCVCIPRHLAG